MKTLILSIILMGLAFAGFAITILLKKGGKFPDTHVGHNKEMKKRGLSCANNENMGCNSVGDKSSCSSCSLIGNTNKK